MELTIKSIINNLFEAKIRYQGIEVTAIGETKDIATKNALEWLKRELRLLSFDSDLPVVENLASNLKEGQPLQILKGEEWKKREREIQAIACEVGQIVIKSAVKHAMKASVTGAIGLLI